METAAAFLAACTFKEKFALLLKITKVLAIKIVSQIKIFANQRDVELLKVTEHRGSRKSRKNRMARNDKKIAKEDLFEEVEDMLNDPRIAY